MKRNFTLLLLSLITNAHSQDLIQHLYQDTAHNDTHTAIYKIVHKNAPGVLILPAWMGIDQEAKDAALSLAEADYNVFIADIYGTKDTPKNTEEAKEMSSFYKNNPEKFRHKIQLALNEFVGLGTDENKIATIGYCFGGTGTLEAARGNMKFTGVVSIHGGLKKVDESYANIQPKVLVIHPAEDESVSKTDIDLFMDEMRQRQADWQFFYYANSKHTFTNPASKDYNPLMTQRAWNHVLLFLKEVLR